MRTPEKDPWHLWDLRTNTKIFDLPEHYGNWSGYYDPGSSCRLTGDLGRILPAHQRPAHQRHALSSMLNATTPAPNCL